MSHAVAMSSFTNVATVCLSSEPTVPPPPCAISYGELWPQTRMIPESRVAPPVLMAEPNIQSVVELLLASQDALVATKYLTASAAVIALWEALLSVDEELAYIWPLDFGLTKIVFYVIRYVTIGCLIYANYMLSGFGNPTDIECKVFLVLLCAITLLYSATVNAYIAFRLYALWDQRKSMRIVLGIAMGTTYIPMFVLGGISASKFYDYTYVAAPTHTCLVTNEDLLMKGVFGCMFAFDVLVITLTVFNALDRPRRPQHKLIESFRRDGAIWFFILSLMRLVNFVLFLVLLPEQIFVVIFFTWAIISIIFSRMILRVEAIKRPTRRPNVRTWFPRRDAFQLEEWSQQSHSTDAGHVGASIEVSPS